MVYPTLITTIVHLYMNLIMVNKICDFQQFFPKTKVALATESSMYVWSRARVVLVHIPIYKSLNCPFMEASHNKKYSFILVCKIVHSSMVL